MKTNHQTACDILNRIYQTYRRKYPENSSDSRQMCLMWSTDEPPDIIEDTPPFDDIADAFGITINWEEALELYDMHLDEAVTQLIEMQQRQCHQGNAG